MPVFGVPGSYPLFAAAPDKTLQWLYKAISSRLAPAMQRYSPAIERHDIDKGHSMSTVEQTDLRQTSDEELAKQYLEFVHSGKRGSSMYQSVELEMRARNLIRQSRLDTAYTAPRSSFTPRASMFSSFR